MAGASQGPAPAPGPAPAEDAGRTSTPASVAGRAPAAARSTVLQGGRAKAYRPLPVEARVAAVAEGLEAYRRGDVFLAHELLEPAWMGTADIAERELVQGLIKLAAGYVHAVRGNPAGVTKNLAGARAHLAIAERSGRPATAADTPGTGVSIAVPALAEIDLARLIADIDRVVARVARDGDVPRRRPGIHRRRES